MTPTPLPEEIIYVKVPVDQPPLGNEFYFCLDIDGDRRYLYYDVILGKWDNDVEPITHWLRPVTLESYISKQIAEKDARIELLENDNRLKEQQRSDWAEMVIKKQKRIELLESNFLKAINDLEFLKAKAEDVIVKATYQLGIITLNDYK